MQASQTLPVHLHPRQIVGGWHSHDMRNSKGMEKKGEQDSCGRLILLKHMTLLTKNSRGHLCKEEGLQKNGWVGSKHVLLSFLFGFFFLMMKEAGTLKQCPPPVVIETITEDTDHEL